MVWKSDAIRPDIKEIGGKLTKDSVAVIWPLADPLEAVDAHDYPKTSASIGGYIVPQGMVREGKSRGSSFFGAGDEPSALPRQSAPATIHQFADRSRAPSVSPATSKVNDAVKRGKREESIEQGQIQQLSAVAGGFDGRRAIWMTWESGAEPT